MGKIKVLVFINSFRNGGSERQAVELVKRLDQSRFEPMVACFQNDGNLSKELPNGLDGIQAFPLAGFFNAAALRQAARFLRLLRRAHVQVVQCFDFYSNLFAIPLARIAGVPVVIGSRREEGVLKLTVRQQRVQRWCYALATGVVANAGAIKTHLVNREGLRAERVWVVHNGVDLDRFHNNEGPSPIFARADYELIIAVVANLRREKGHLVFLDAAQRLIRRYPQARFLIVGDGSMRKTIETRIGELGLTGRVALLGEVDNVPELLCSVDILVLPSLHNEGLPNAVMEAMAASLPVVATDTGGVRDLVIDGLTGFIVPPRDPTALADRMGRLCSDLELRRKMGEAGERRIIELFTAEQMARKFENLYQRLVEAS